MIITMTGIIGILILTGHIGKHTIQTTSSTIFDLMIDIGASIDGSSSGKGATRMKHRWPLCLLLLLRRRRREHTDWSLACKETISWRGRKVEGIEWRGSSCSCTGIIIVVEERAIACLS